MFSRLTEVTLSTLRQFQNLQVEGSDPQDLTSSTNTSYEYKVAIYTSPGYKCGLLTTTSSSSANFPDTVPSSLLIRTDATKDTEQQLT